MTTFLPDLTQRLVIKAKKRIIPNWKSRIGDYSTIALAALTGVGGIWVAIPEDIKATFGPAVASWVGKAMLALAMFGVVGKFLRQPGKDGE